MKIVEWCSNCCKEVELENKMTFQSCPCCNKPIFPCSKCDFEYSGCSDCPYIAFAKYLDIELEDDDKENGGIAFIGETVKDFIEDVGIHFGSIIELNKALIENGIKPLEVR